MLSSKRITFVFLLLAVVTLSHNSNVMNAYVDLTSGKAITFSQQAKAAYKTLSTTTKDTVYVNELVKKPLILPVRWPERHNQMVNGEWQEYFKVKKVLRD